MASYQHPTYSTGTGRRSVTADVHAKCPCAGARSRSHNAVTRTSACAHAHAGIYTGGYLAGTWRVPTGARLRFPHCATNRRRHRGDMQSVASTSTHEQRLKEVRNNNSGGGQPPAAERCMVPSLRVSWDCCRLSAGAGVWGLAPTITGANHSQSRWSPTLQSACYV